MATRRHFNASVVELEQLFQSAQNDHEVLTALRDELVHRNTRRAQKLAASVARVLASSPSSVETDNINRTAARRTSTTRVEPHSNQGMDSLIDPDVASESMTRQAPKTADSTSSSIESPQQDSADASTHSPPKQAASVACFGDATPDFAVEGDVKPGADSILAAWLALEVLSPHSIPGVRELISTGRTLVRLDESPEPWRERRYWTRDNERAVYWMVYLAELDLAKATDEILRIYPDDVVDERANVRGTTTLAVVVVDSFGKPVENKIFLSSFAWGYGQIRNGHLNGLARFPVEERQIVERLEKGFTRLDEEGQIVPLTRYDLEAATDWLSTKLSLPASNVIRPGIAIRVPRFGDRMDAPEPELLNSFFINDLVLARDVMREGKAGRALSSFLGTNDVAERIDIVRHVTQLRATLAPGNMPLARWPGAGRYPLVLMQQAAINHAMHELAKSGVVGVNGPPGTGKTTLLRDVVAKVVLDRATVLAGFENPLDAFSHVTSMRTGGGYTHLYKLDDSLLGHEIVVASSNNKAVENISREIPSASAVSDDLDPPARYFQSISDQVATGKGAVKVGATWGLVAAALGNSANREVFAQSFWWDKQRGMACYLKAVLEGERTEVAAIGDDGAETREVPEVITSENPPCGEIEARERWRLARKRFKASLEKVESIRNRLQFGYEAVKCKPTASQQLREAVKVLDSCQINFTDAAEREKIAKLASEYASREQHDASKLCDDVRLLRPGFFARLFRTRSYRDWLPNMSDALDGLASARMRAVGALEASRQAGDDLRSQTQLLRSAESKKKEAEQYLNKILSVIESVRGLVGENMADDEFWAVESSTLQLRSPWVFDEFQRARDSLFVEAFALHRAFIDAAAKPLRHNVRAALELLKGRALRNKQEEARTPLWASLFLVVPVISTTFASASRLFGPLGREKLGWVLVDEAGQAAPQQAVGLLWRARRAIVIGDPMQIQPVVTTPRKLIRALFAEHKVNPEEWAAPNVSAQILADRVSWFGTNIITDNGDVWVGSPLRVHRRCENPMFKISNHVAYDSLMVYGTQEGDSEIGKRLGPSCWIDAASDAVGKWSHQEGVFALQLLRDLLDAGLANPDVFFITPFRIVARNLRELIRNDPGIAKRLPCKSEKWVAERVGTVHTFQGKEAEAVVVVLGAPLDESAGARRWAGCPPNLLNVAVTRAKQRLYVIGSREAWKNAGAFTHLAQNLPLRP